MPAPPAAAAAAGLQAGPAAGASSGGNRARNVRDSARLREWYPGYCTHHLLYHHVLGRPPSAGCTNAEPGAAGCYAGDRFRSHDAPDDLEECDLEAFHD